MATKTRKSTKGAKVCPTCEAKFVDPVGNRYYCTTCSPPKHRKDLPAPLPVEITQPTKGKPFTVAHAKKWMQAKKLKDGSFFKMEEYQELFLVDLFARKPDGTPKFQELWLVVPEGNGKTTFICLVILYFITHKNEAWVPIAASARDQAVTLTYRNSSGFVQRNRLEGEFALHPGYREIKHKHSLGTAKIFASDAASGDGVDPDLALIEELHRLPDTELYETWAGKLDKSDGQLVVVSTAGEPDTPFELLRTAIRQQALDVKRVGRCYGRYEGAGVVLHEYAIPEDGDPEDLELVVEANPFSGITLEKIKAKRAKPSWNLPHWRRFTCNMPTRDVSAAITEQEWAAAYAEWDVPSGEEIWAGVDVAWRWDTTAITPHYLRDDGHAFLGPPMIFTPPRDGSSLDVSLVKRGFQELKNQYPKFTTVVMDMHLAEDLADWLQTELGLVVIDRAQTNAPKVEEYTKFMESLRGGTLHQCGDVELRRHALNAVTKILSDGSARFARSSPSRMGNQDARVLDALDAGAMVHVVHTEPAAPPFKARSFS